MRAGFEETVRSMSGLWQVGAVLLVALEGVCAARALHAARGGS